MPRNDTRIGLALAGGGPEGAVYELGAIRALDEALEGFDLNHLHVYVGVSAGSFVASCLVNGMTSRQLCRATVKSDADVLPFAPETFLTPALGEWMRRGLTMPRLAFDALMSYASNPADQSLLESFLTLSRALPTGLFDNEPIRAFLERIFSMERRTNDFRELAHKLVIVAADLDSGKAVCFGDDGFDHVPISTAVQASTALPGLYPPVDIGGRSYVDGVLLKTLHASVALESGADLVFAVNPIVPVDTQDAVSAGAMRRGKLVNRGLPTVLSQTFRTLVHSRLSVGIAAYHERYPSADVVLLEPGRDDYRMFFTNIFSFSSRRAVCEHAYHSVRRQLLERHEELAPLLSKHRIRIRTDVLRDPDRDLWQQVGLPGKAPSHVTRDLDRTLARLEGLLGNLEPGVERRGEPAPREPVETAWRIPGGPTTDDSKTLGPLHELRRIAAKRTAPALNRPLAKSENAVD